MALAVFLAGFLDGGRLEFNETVAESEWNYRRFEVAEEE